MSASWKASRADRGARHLTGDRDDRDRVHVGVGDRGDQVGRARAGGGDADADLAGGLRVPGGGVPRALLVADQDVPDRRVEERVVRRQDRAARNAERDVDAERLERLHERLGAGHLERRGGGWAARAAVVGWCGGRGDLGRDGGRGGVDPLGDGLGRGSRHGGWPSARAVVVVSVLRASGCTAATGVTASGHKNGPRADARGQRTLWKARVRSDKYSRRPGRRHGAKPDASHAMSQLISHSGLASSRHPIVPAGGPGVAPLRQRLVAVGGRRARDRDRRPVGVIRCRRRGPRDGHGRAVRRLGRRRCGPPEAHGRAVRRVRCRRRGGG